MNKPLHRFDFGTLRDFRGPLSFVPEMPSMAADEPQAPPPPPTYDDEQLQQARIDAKKAGYQEGFAAGLSQAAAETESRQIAADEAMRNIAAQVQSLSDSYMAILEEQSKQLPELAFAIARKVAKEALDARGTEVIAAMVGRCLPVLYQRPRLTIELNPDTLPAAEPRLRELLRNQAFEGELQFRANPSLAVADARIDWGNGAAERNTAALWKQIEELIGRVPVRIDIPTPHHKQAETSGE